MASTGEKVVATIYYDGGGTWNTTPTVANLSTSDNTRAVASVGDDPCVLGDFDFSSIVGEGVIIEGIEVKVEGSDSTAGSTVDYEIGLSNDGGSTFPFTKSDSFTGTTDATDVLGGATDLWSGVWTDNDFDFGTFALSIEATSGTGRLRIDLVTVNVYYSISKFTIVQTAKGVTSGGGTSASAAFASNVTAGNAIVACVATGVGAISSVSDDLSNSYSQAVRRVNFSYVDIWYANDIAGGSCTVTANFAASTHAVLMLYEVEIDGGGTLSVDQTATAGGDGVTANTPTVTTSATTEADELVVAASGVFFGSGTDAYSVGSGFIEFLGDNSLPITGQTVSAGAEIKLVNTTGTQTADFNLSFGTGAWEEAVATFAIEAPVSVTTTSATMSLMGV